MTVRIVDRRQDSKNKSSINRSRFIHRFKGQIRKGGRRHRQARHPRPRQRREDRHSWQDIGNPISAMAAAASGKPCTGNDRFNSGDEWTAPEGGGAGQGQRPGQPRRGGDGRLCLHPHPGRIPRHLLRRTRAPQPGQAQPPSIDEYKRVPGPATLKAGCRPTSTWCAPCAAPPAAGWRFPAPTAHACGNCRKNSTACAGIAPATRTSSASSGRSPASRPGAGDPFIDPFDLRYSNRIRIPQPSTQAVMFCPDGRLRLHGRAEEADGQAFLHAALPLLNRNYEHIEVVFIRHHTTAEEVDGTISSIPGKPGHHRLQRLEADARSSPPATRRPPGTSTAPRLPTATTGTTIHRFAGNPLENRSCRPSNTSPISKSPRPSRKIYGPSTSGSRAAIRKISPYSASAAPRRYLPGVPQLFRKRLVCKNASAPSPRVWTGPYEAIQRYDNEIGRVAGLRPGLLPPPAEIITAEQMMDAYAPSACRSITTTGPSASTSSRPRTATSGARWAWPTRDRDQ